MPSARVQAMDEFSDLKGGVGGEEENAALAAAVSLFATVFRLQTSDVRSQLLGHLSTAATKAAEKLAKESRSSGGVFGGGGGAPEKSGLASPLANVSAALLGSLTKLKHRPSKSPLAPALADKIDGVLAPCLSDADPAVRRAAAQSVGLATELLGQSYAATPRTHPRLRYAATSP